MDFRLTKIVATVGPASKDRESLKALILAGVNVFRLNFSHAIHDEQHEIIKNIRELGEALKMPVAILADLQGPKHRTGLLKDGIPIELYVGQQIDLKVSKEIGTSECLTTPNPELVEVLNIGQTVLLADGTMALEVTKVHSQEHVTCKVTVGGKLGEKKGINLPGLKLKIAALTEKDKKDALFAFKAGVDFMALSFVQSQEDIKELRNFLLDNCTPEMLAKATLPPIVAKIERPTSLDDIDEIIRETDIIMVARGDLGVEMSPEKVPVVQKMLIKKANIAEKPVITATQILESMIQSPVPTRAEVSDAVNAVFDGSDALMLSGETAMGLYPIKCVETMAKVMREAEANLPDGFSQLNIGDKFLLSNKSELNSLCSLEFHETIAECAVVAAQRSAVQAIVVLSYSGRMARRISKRKPPCPVIALTPHASVLRSMSLLWGVYPLLIDHCENSDEMLMNIEAIISRRDLIEHHSPILFCAGQTSFPVISNTLKIYRFGDLGQIIPKSSAQNGELLPT